MRRSPLSGSPLKLTGNTMVVCRRKNAEELFRDVYETGKQSGRRRRVKLMNKKMMEFRIIMNEIIGFGAVIILLWLNELIDLPHHLFGAQLTPFNWIESTEETVFILVFAAVVVTMSSRIVRKVKYLEGFLPVCATCKRIRINDEWIPIEVYISKHSEAVFSHGFCPDCMAQYQERYRDELS